jgi:hypothetical protein
VPCSFTLSGGDGKHWFLVENKKATVSGGLFLTPPPLLAGVVWGGPLARMGRAQFHRARSASRGATALLRSYVPISHDARYFTCSFVSVSIFIPMPASLSRAISLSMTGGTG